MGEKLIRVGTTYLPVQDVALAADWYTTKLEAQLNYIDDEKAILAIADQAFFLVKAKQGETSNFIDVNGNERFTLTFEVDGEEKLVELQKDLQAKDVEVGQIEDRGHPGRNFVFKDPDGNRFDVWSCLSPKFKERLKVGQ